MSDETIHGINKTRGGNGRPKRHATNSINYSLNGAVDDEGWELDTETGRRKNGEAAVFKGDDDDDDDEFSVKAAAVGGKSSMKKRKRGLENDDDDDDDKKSEAERKVELKNDDKQRKENVGPNAAVSTALVKADGAKSTVEPSDTKIQAILDKINSRKCSSSNCDKTYISFNVYTQENPSGIGYCDTCFRKEIAALTDEEKILHQELKVQHFFETQRKNSKNGWVNGASLDEHIYNFAKDPELLSIEVDDAGLLTILAGFFSDLRRLLQVTGFKELTNNTKLMDALRHRYEVLPDASICSKGYGPDDEGRTRLKNGWADRNVLLWFDQYDLDEHGGVPKFGMSAKYKKQMIENRQKRRAKKDVAKEAAATAALAAVLESAQDNQNGVPDAKVLTNALVLGYSKAFIDAKIAEQEELNVKPAAR